MYIRANCMTLVECLVGSLVAAKQVRPMKGSGSSLKGKARGGVRKASKNRVLGRPLEIAAAIYRLPEIRRSVNKNRNKINRVNQTRMLASVSKLNAQQLEIRRDQENLLRSVPVALRSVAHSIKNLTTRLDRQEASVGYALGRIEFVRRELMYELKYGEVGPGNQGSALAVETKIIDLEKVQAAQASELRLNLGCGHIALDGFINVDLRALDGVDVVAEVDSLPFEKETVDEIFSSHVLEHFPEEELRRKLLPYWVELIKPGGTFRAIVPDIIAMNVGYQEGTVEYEDLRAVTYGGQEYAGDFHFNMFTPESLTKILEEAGLVNTEVIARGRRNGACLEFEISAKKAGEPA